jgi:hypothetical protein
MTWNDYAGIIHLHSRYSFDGRAAIPEITAAARGQGVHFLMLTDHSTLAARSEGLEGYHQGVLLIVGEEIAPRFNHYLAFGHRQAIAQAGIAADVPPQETIDAVRGQGALGFIAHPDHRGTALFHVKHYPWLDWSVSGYTGLGIWDFMTDWQLSLSDYGSALGAYFCPALGLRGPLPETLARWDLLAQERRVVGIGELDNHDTLRRWMGVNLRVFPFRRVMNLIRTHLLTATPLSGESKRDIPLLLEALENGRAYVSLDRFRSATGFAVTLREGDRVATMGEKFLLEGDAELQVRAPASAKIRVVRNGSPFGEAQGTDLRAGITEPGVYRVEVCLKTWGRLRPWIFSNPIYVKKAGAAMVGAPGAED